MIVLPKLPQRGSVEERCLVFVLWGAFWRWFGMAAR